MPCSGIDVISRKFNIQPEHLTKLETNVKYLQFHGLPLDAELYERSFESYSGDEPLDLDVYMFVPSSGEAELLNPIDLGRHFTAVTEERFFGLLRKQGKLKDDECDTDK